MELPVPHLTIEYSANLEPETDIGALCETLRRSMLETGHFEIGAVRVRAHKCDHYAIADLHPDNAFINMDLKIGAGRSPYEKQHMGETIFDAAVEQLKSLFEIPHFALSLYIDEYPPERSWKKNSIHPRLR